MYLTLIVTLPKFPIIIVPSAPKYPILDIDAWHNEK